MRERSGRLPVAPMHMLRGHRPLIALITPLRPPAATPKGARMATYEDRAKLLWSLSGAGLSSTISGAGNSGGWGITPTSDYPQSAIPLSPASDIQLMVSVTGKTSTPTFAVQLGYFDGQGNLFAPSALTLAVPVTSVPATAFLNAGVRAGSGGTSYFVFPAWGQVSWTCTGGSVTGVEISLWGR